MSPSRKWSKIGADSADKIATRLASLSRSQLKRQLLTMRTRFRLDFTEEFLDSLSRDKLQHILLAAQLNAH